MRTVRNLSRGLVLIAALSLTLPAFAFAKDLQAATAAPAPKADAAERVHPVPYQPAVPRSEARPVPLPAWEETLRMLVAKAWCTGTSPCTSLCTANCCGTGGSSGTCWH